MENKQKKKKKLKRYLKIFNNTRVSGGGYFSESQRRRFVAAITKKTQKNSKNSYLQINTKENHQNFRSIKKAQNKHLDGRASLVGSKEGGFRWWCFGSVEARSGGGRVRRRRGAVVVGLCGGGR